MYTKPNILFLFSDQHRGDWLPYTNEQFAKMGCEPIPLKMNNVQTLMENGTTFTRAITNSPLCVPARACLASGLNYKNCQVYNNDYCFPLNQKTFYSVLKDGGYNVGGTGKFDLHKPILFWDTSGWLEQLSKIGFTKAIDSEGKYDLIWSSFYTPKGPYSHFLHENGFMRTHAIDYIKRYFDAHNDAPTPLPDFAYSDNWLTKNALNILSDFKNEKKPWFMMVNFTGPHNPWDITENMKKRWQNISFPLPSGFSGDTEKINRVRQNYAAMLENIDTNIGLLLNFLRKTDQFDNTLIIYSSDHGEMLGDKNRYFKTVPDRASIHIPLVISAPNGAKNILRDDMVQLHDIAETITDFAGFSLPKPNDSLSLKSLLCNPELSLKRDYQLSSLYNSKKFGKPYKDYIEYDQYKKEGDDYFYIKKYNRELGLTESTDSVKKHNYQKDWDVVITKKYKLVKVKDEPICLFDIENDVWEMDNIAKKYPDIVKLLLAVTE